MDLKTIIKEYGIEKLSQETYIPIDVLKQLENNDFKGLSRAKISGFLSILEREYGLDIHQPNTDTKPLENNNPQGVIPYEINKKRTFLGIIVFLFMLWLFGDKALHDATGAFFLGYYFSVEVVNVFHWSLVMFVSLLLLFNIFILISSGIIPRPLGAKQYDRMRNGKAYI